MEQLKIVQVIIIIKTDIYVYDPNNENEEETRYRVTFSYNQNGTYIRKVDNNGQVYYEYYYNNDNSADIYLYSPFQLMNTPTLSEVFFSKVNYKIGDNFNFSTLIGHSNHDRNIFSNISDNNKGNLYDFGFNIDSLEIGKYNFSISGSNLIREKIIDLLVMIVILGSNDFGILILYYHQMKKILQ